MPSVFLAPTGPTVILFDALTPNQRTDVWRALEAIPGVTFRTVVIDGQAVYMADDKAGTDQAERIAGVLPRLS